MTLAAYKPTAGRPGRDARVFPGEGTRLASRLIDKVFRRKTWQKILGLGRGQVSGVSGGPAQLAGPGCAPPA